MTTNDVADKMRTQRIRGSGFWRSGNQEPRKGKGGEGGDVFQGCEVGKIRLGDKKSDNISHDPRCNRRRKRRRRLLKTAPYVPESRVVR